MICEATEEQIVRDFFRQRFKREPESDRAYFEEWRERFFVRPPPEDFMDTESRLAYIKVLRDALKRKCGD